MRLPVAIQFYSVRDEAEKDFRGTLQKIKDMGYEGVEFAGLFGNDPKDVKQMCKEIGIVPISAHVPLDELLSDIEGTVSAYETIGCRFIAIPYCPEDRRPGKSRFDETLDDIRKIGAVCVKHNMTLLYHNHDFEFAKVDGEIGLDLLYRKVDRELLETELDVCWVNVGGEDPSEYILKYSGRSPIVHLKDFVMKGKDKPKKLYNLIGIDDDAPDESGDDFSFMPVGQGVQDMESILDSSVKAGAEWFVVEQDQPNKGNTSLQCAEQSIEYLKKVNK